MVSSHPLFRLDRFFTLGLFRPLMRLELLRRRPGIPILMYHSISKDLDSVRHPYYQTNTSPHTFREHMAFLNSNEYSVLPLKEAVNLLQTGHALNGKAVVLTFDDGFKDFLTEAFPILQEYGYPSTVFLPTAFVDDHHSNFRGKSCLSWDDVRELHEYGVSFGSHSETHPELITLNAADIKAELEHSKIRIETELNESIESFSYPFAFPERHSQFISELKRFLQDLGYLFGVTTKVGIAYREEDSFFLKRIPVNEYDDSEFLKAKLCGAYNWIRAGQILSKSLENLVAF